MQSRDVSLQPSQPRSCSPARHCTAILSVNEQVSELGYVHKRGWFVLFAAVRFEIALQSLAQASSVGDKAERQPCI
jgi:hypothetical protein